MERRLNPWRFLRFQLVVERTQKVVRQGCQGIRRSDRHGGCGTAGARGTSYGGAVRKQSSIDKAKEERPDSHKDRQGLESHRYVEHRDNDDKDKSDDREDGQPRQDAALRDLHSF